MTIEAILISAIQNRQSLLVTYDGHFRRIAPCRFGWKNPPFGSAYKNLFCYQFAGYSSKGLKPEGSLENFRCWHVDKITSAAPIPDLWRCPNNWFREPSTCIDVVLAGPPL